MHEFIDRTAFVMLKREQYCKDCAKRKDSKGKTVYQIGDVSCRSCRINDVLEDVEDFPPSAVRPVKRGRWMAGIHGSVSIVCSVCGYEWYAASTMSQNYCPNCGADMREG